MPEKSILIINEVEQLETLHEQIEELGEEWSLSAKLIMQLKLVSEEIFSNIVFYGYTDKEPHHIEFLLTKDETKISMQITDDAIAFNPLQAKAPDLDLAAEDRPIGGLGIHFIQQLMDEITYQRVNNNNVLLLRKAL